MKKILLAGFALLGTASAQGGQWQHAEYSELTVSGKTSYSWIQRPSAQNTFAQESLQTLGKNLGCNYPITNRPLLFTCMGEQGWELVTLDRSKTQYTELVAFYFKRSN